MPRDDSVINFLSAQPFPCFSSSPFVSYERVGSHTSVLVCVRVAYRKKAFGREKNRRLPMFSFHRRPSGALCSVQVPFDSSAGSFHSLPPRRIKLLTSRVKSLIGVLIEKRLGIAWEGEKAETMRPRRPISLIEFEKEAEARRP